jgi:hypothetical protein
MTVADQTSRRPTQWITTDAVRSSSLPAGQARAYRRPAYTVGWVCAVGSLALARLIDPDWLAAVTVLAAYLAGGWWMRTTYQQVRPDPVLVHDRWIIHHRRWKPADVVDWLVYRSGRLACRLLRRHNVSCRGRLDHVRPDGTVVEAAHR